MSPRGLTFRYVFALTLVAVMSACVLGLSWSATRQAAHDGELINQSGRQRMLSQRLALSALELRTVADESIRSRAREALGQDLALFTTSHGELVPAAELDDTVRQIYQHPDIGLAERSRAFAFSIAQVLQGDESEILLTQVLNQAEAILPVLDQATNAFAAQAQARTRRLEQLELLAFTLTLFVLLFEALYIFRPAVNAIGRSLRDARQAQKQAEAAAEAKTQFLATMSHEIRTPLNGVFGMATALNGTQLDASQRKMVSTIQSSGDLLLTVVNDILDLSKIEADEMDLEQTDMSLEQVLNWVDSTFRPDCEAKGVAYRTLIEDGAKGWFKGDPTRLRQILANLVSNAVKFTAEGEVTVEARVLDVTDGETKLELAVRDSGIGIPEDRLGSIFNPFEQADSTTTRHYGGTGLGLTISSRLARLMGGWIEASSTPGTGSEFRVRLTLTEGRAPAPVENRTPDSPANALRILAVDDVATNRLVLKTLLSQLGADCVEAGSGAEALELASRESFDLVLMDVQMPEMDGIEATRRLHQLWQEQGQSPADVVAVTANVLQEQVAAYHAAGLTRHLGKPVKLDELQTLLQSTEPVTPADQPEARTA